jgi:Caspase domain
MNPRIGLFLGNPHIVFQGVEVRKVSVVPTRRTQPFWFRLELAVILLIAFQLAQTASADTPKCPIGGVDPDAVLATIPKQWLHNPPPPELPAATPDLPKDNIQPLIAAHRKYRLVIGASEFRDSPAYNADFVAGTAAVVDQRLCQLGYEAIDSLKSRPVQYLVGEQANLDAIKSALEELAQATEPGDFAIVYFATHGNLPPSNADLVLSVYDRPVTKTDGLRISDLIGELALSKWYRTNALDTANFLLVIDACYSGNFLKQVEGITQMDGVQRIVASADPPIPERFALITATGSGATTEAYQLGDLKLTAFGAYFARSLKEDWTCADSNFDGIVTAGELRTCIQDGLDRATSQGAIKGNAMSPQVAHPEALVAFNADKYRSKGERPSLVLLKVAPKNALSANTALPFQVHLPNGAIIPCERSCQVWVEKSDQPGKLQIDTASGDSFADVVAIGPGPLDPSARSKRIEVPIKQVIRAAHSKVAVEGLLISLTDGRT